MKFTDFSIDNFGALSKFSLSEIASGLNVLHGPNGSGKTTLLQFIRGVFAGFTEARRLQLIPPVGAGAAGGTIGVEWGSRQLAVIRHSRPDEYETLAINVRQGQSDEGQALRKHLESFDDERLSVLFTAGSFDANSVEALIGLARQDGLDLTTVIGNERALSARLMQLHSQKSALQRDIGGPGLRAELQSRREAIAAQGLSIQKQADDRRAELLRARVALDERLDATDREIASLHADWQSLIADLRECEDRLWSATSRTVQDVVYVQETQPPASNPRLPEVEELDLRIEHLRVVLKDLAASRRQVSVEAADAAGSDVPDRLAFARRQREALRVMQMQLQALGGTTQWLESASRTGQCVCQSAHERLASVADELRRQVELACQELSRQQTAWRLEQSRQEIAAIDSTEQGLQRQIDWLRARREELLEDAAHPVLSRLAHTVMAERQYCGCPEHSATMRATTPRVVTRRTVQERQDLVSSARPGDANLREALAAQSARAWQQWQAAIGRSIDIAHHRRRVIAEFHAIDVEAALADCERRLGDVQRQLAELDARQSELQAIEAEIRGVEGQLVRDQSSRVISEASEYLNLLTLGRYCALRTSEDGHRLQIIAENGSPYVASALSRGTLFQVALALRVALVDEYARRGLDFPLVLDDVLVDSDEHRLEAAAHLLSAAADRGRQILFLTCQDHLVDMLEDRNATVFMLPGSNRIRTARPVFVPAAPPALSITPSVAAPVVPAPQPAAEAAVPQVDADAAIVDRESPLFVLPSLTSQLAVILAGEGIEILGQLIDLETDLERRLVSHPGLTRQDLATLQAEAALLVGLPGLPGDDARLLAAIGIRNPSELHSFTADVLWQRIQRFRGSTPQPWHAWIRDRNSWPQEEEIAWWIRLSQRPLGERAIVAFTRAAHDDADAVDDDSDDDGPQPAGEHDSASRKRTRRSRRSRFSAGSTARARGSASASASAGPRFYLTLDSPIVDAPSIGPKTSRMLNRAGVQTVAHLLQRGAAELAENIADRSVTAETIVGWQQQSRLMCAIAELRGHDAQLLVACGFTSVEAVAEATVSEIEAKIVPFAATKPGQRMLRTSAAPDRDEIAQWVAFVREQRHSRAA